MIWMVIPGRQEAAGVLQEGTIAWTDRDVVQRAMSPTHHTI